MEFKKYRRTNIAEMSYWKKNICMTGVSVSDVDAENGSPKLGDMIARNPKNHNDMWLVAKTYFEENFEEVPKVTKD